MSALLLGLLLATQPTSSAPNPPLEMIAATPEATPATTTATPATTTATTLPAVSMRGPVGVGLLAVGASLAAGGTIAFTLIEAVNTPDRTSNPPSAAVERFTTISGFLGVATASVSAVLVVIGAGLTLSESGDGDVPQI